MIRSFPIFAAPILLIAGFCVAARADVKTACMADVKSYCSGIEAKGGKLRDCMAENRAKLSKDCKIAIAERVLERQAKAAEAKRTGKPAAKTDDEE